MYNLEKLQCIEAFMGAALSFYMETKTTVPDDRCLSVPYYMLAAASCKAINKSKQANSGLKSSYQRAFEGHRPIRINFR